MWQKLIEDWCQVNNQSFFDNRLFSWSFLFLIFQSFSTANFILKGRGLDDDDDDSSDSWIIIDVVKLSCFQEEMMVKEDSIKLEKKKNLKKKQIKEKQCGGRYACRLHKMSGQQACRPHTTEKKHGSVYWQAEDTVDNLAQLSITKGPESDQVSCLGAFRFSFWWTPNRTQILYIEVFVFKDQRVRIVLD